LAITLGDPAGIGTEMVCGSRFDTAPPPRDDAVAMTKSVTVAELAEHLEDHLAEVQDGTTIEVVREGAKIATITPAPKKRKFVIPPPGERACDIVFTPLSKPLDQDPAEMIIEERERERSGAKYK
jgi:antitoxin (DNA-binding transcriptional repressor) of toxin-antitoxin stability system